MTTKSLETMVFNKSKYLRISSKDRTNPQAPTSDFRVNIPNRDLMSVKGFILSHVSFPNMNKTIDDDILFHFSWDESGALPPGDFVVTLLEGNYNITELMLHIQTVMNTSLQLVSANYAITVTLVDDRIVFTSTGVTAGTIYTYEQGGIVNELLGIDFTDTASTSESPHTLGSTPNLFSTKDVLITSNVLSDSTGTLESSNKFLSSIAHCPIDTVAYGNWSLYQTRVPELDSIVYQRDKDISTIDIQMRRDDGSIIDLQGLHWEFTIKFYY